jgi:cytochrome c oxidase cbb3-type subunit 3
MTTAACRFGIRASVVAVLATTAIACSRGPREDARAPAAAPPDAVRQVDFVPGGAEPPTVRANPFDGDAHALAEGRRLYDWMNCSGCHFAGGGGIGPPLMDDDWIYGGRPDQIFDSIASGRSNGMPAYGDKLATGQIWRIVAHVQSLHQGPDDRRREGEPEDPADEGR